MPGFLLTSPHPAATRLTSAEFLRQSPQGPYTSLVVRRDGSIPNFDLHAQRLEESLAIRRATTPSERWGSDPWGSSQPDNLRAQLDERLQTALQEVNSPGEPSKDLSVVALLVQNRRGVDVHLHITPLTWPTASLGRPACAEVFENGPRINALAKDSQWLRDRSALEAALPPGTEGILSDSQGSLLEGFVTNVFIVREDGFLQTASPAGDQVLDGIMRRTVIKCCEQAGVHVEESAPNLADSHLWQEGFLTNWYSSGDPPILHLFHVLGIEHTTSTRPVPLAIPCFQIIALSDPFA